MTPRLPFWQGVAVQLLLLALPCAVLTIADDGVVAGAVLFVGTVAIAIAIWWVAETRRKESTFTSTDSR